MAVKLHAVFQGKKGEQFLSVTRKNISVGKDRWTQQELVDLKQLMVQKIRKFTFEGTLERSLIIGQEFKTEDKVAWSLFTDEKHAFTNEFGTEDRYVATAGKPNLIAWCDKKLGIVPKYIHVGGKGSKARIPAGHSKNKFFFNSIDEYVASNLSKGFARELRKIINKQ